MKTMNLPLTRCVIPVDTQDKCTRILEALEKADDRYGWANGGKKPTAIDCWEDYKEETCICIGWDKGYFGNDEEHDLGYADLDYFEKQDANFISYEEALTILQNSMKKTFYNLEVGDIVVSEGGSERMVLGVHEGANPLYHLSSHNDFECNGSDLTAKDLEEYGYTIKGQDDEVEKAIKLLEKKGRLKDGKILN